MIDAFLSYKSEERERIQAIAEILESLGITLWFDQGIEIGRNFDENIEEKLRSSSAVIVFWSSRSIESEWVIREATIADFTGNIVPVFLDDVTPPKLFRRREGARLKGWIGDPSDGEWKLLLSTLEKLTSRNDLLVKDSARDWEPPRLTGREIREDRKRQKKRILSLDGCGLRVFLQLALLEALEDYLVTKSIIKQSRLADYFDLIGGTSVGGLVAMLLTFGLSAREIREILLREGPEIWKRKTAFRKTFIESNRRVDHILEDVMSHCNLGDSRISTGFAICVKRADTGSAWVITNNPHAKHWQYTEPISMKALARACIVMPETPQPTWVELEGSPQAPGTYAAFIDGCFGGLANPSFRLLMTATRPEHGLQWALGPDQLLMLSIGGGQWNTSISQRNLGDSRQHLAATLDGLVTDTIHETTVAMQAISKVPQGWAIDSELGDMTGLPETGKEMLTFQRLDADLDQFMQSTDKSSNRKTKHDIRSFRLPFEAEIVEDLREAGKQAAEGFDFARLLPITFDVRYETA